MGIVKPIRPLIGFGSLSFTVGALQGFRAFWGQLSYSVLESVSN